MQKTPPRAKEWSKSKSSPLERKFVITFIRQMLQGILESSSLYLISRMGGSRAHWGGYFFTLEKAKISRFFKLENIQKMLKNQWNIYNFEKIFKFTYKNLNDYSFLPIFSPIF